MSSDSVLTEPTADAKRIASAADALFMTADRNPAMALSPALGIKLLHSKNDRSVFEVPSGTYQFERPAK